MGHLFLPMRNTQRILPSIVVLSVLFLFGTLNAATRDDAVQHFQRWLYKCDSLPTQAEALVLQQWLVEHPDDIDAMYWLAKSYEKKIVERPRDADIFDMIQRSAAGGSAIAQADLGVRYIEGNGIARDRQKGISLLQGAANKGEPQASIALGVPYLELGRRTRDRDATKSAETLFRSAADKGHVRALRLLALACAENGNEIEAFTFMRQGAIAGDLQAEVNLAGFYRHGVGTNRDLAEALRWMKTAADGGLDEAQRELAKYYVGGVVVPQDLKQAFYWNNLAAMQGDVEARLEVANSYLTGSGVDMDINRGRELLSKLAAEDVGQAQWLIGKQYIEGLWLPRDTEKAKLFLTKAADKGIYDAKYYLTWIERNGQ